MLRNKINLKLWVTVLQLRKNYSYLFNLRQKSEKLDA